MGSTLLWPLARVWSAGTRARVALYRGGFLRRYRLRKPVVSVGNLSVGGTGKTPFVIWLWRELAELGISASVLTRGYRRKDRREPLLFESPEGSDCAGDEVRLLLNAGVRPVGVAGRRELAGTALEESNPSLDVHLLDDGFQHLSLVRALDIVLLDCTRPPWEYDLLPAGRLREPVTALARADIVVLTRAYSWTQAAEIEKLVREQNRGALVTRATTEVRMNSMIAATGPALAFAGIGNPKAFYDDLGRHNIEVIDTLSFGDHHRYTAADRAKIIQRAHAAGASVIITTEKDVMNLDGEIPGLVIAPMELIVEDGDAIVNRVMEAIRA